MKSLATHQKMSYFFLFFYLLHTLGFRTGLYLRAGKETVTCCQRSHTTTKSLVFQPAVDMEIASTTTLFHSFFLLMFSELQTVQLTNSTQVCPHSLLLEHSQWPPRGCAHGSAPSCGGEGLLPEP